MLSGQKLHIVVGQKGIDSSGGVQGGGGGGGSFIYDQANPQPFVIAPGGGGTSYQGHGGGPGNTGPTAGAGGYRVAI